MGLAEPRKRIKLSHDPRNLQWSQAEDSYGVRIMQSSGWKPGTALGASSIPIPANEASAAKVRIAVKDNTLGLGASLKSRNVEHQKTGLDAFQGLLGRLNAKDAQELKEVEEKIENKKLALFAQGRWGGMVFVPGGLLVQEDPKTVKEQAREEQQEQMEDAQYDKSELQDASDSEAENMDKATKMPKKCKMDGETAEERAQRKAEKRQRKEDRNARRAAKKLRKLEKLREQSGTSTPVSESTADQTETETGASTPVQDSGAPAYSKAQVRSGRQLLRGRNIQAKRMAFSDTRGLDQIFMIQQQKQAA